MRVQLLYFPGCPNAGAARQALRRALQAEGLTLNVEEVNITRPETPLHLRGWESPTLLIDGIDAMGETPPGDASCRLYPGEDGHLRGAPEEPAVRAALRRARSERRRRLGSLALLPGGLLPLVPGVTCPACLAAYAGLASAAGLSFLLSERAQAPLIVVGLVAGLAGPAWSAKVHRGVGPLVAALAAAGAVVGGRLIWGIPALGYTGVALLIGAALWNLRLGRSRPAPLVQLQSMRKQGGHS